ncbi:thioredoxin-like protein [Cladochytrium replicatum]|nr:thioredoxin-like protein [Cladochytrium replicatum]
MATLDGNSQHSLSEKDGLASGSRSGPSNEPESSRPQNANGARAGQIQRQTTLLSIITFPLTLGFRVAWTVLTYTISLLPLDILLRRPRPAGTSASRRRANASDSTDPRAAAARFLLDFESTYGRIHPHFYQGTYSQALDLAKREIRYFLAILHSEEHDDTEEFCRTVLTDAGLLGYLSEKNFVVWAGDIRESEAFQVSAVLSATKYPFLALIALQGSRTVVINRIEGLKTAEQIVHILSRDVDRLEPQLALIRMEHERREQARTIRQQQDEAYRASLLADQEKERKAAEERERAEKEKAEAERAESERLGKLEAKKERRKKLLEDLPAEPDAGESVTRISIRLPNGDRVVRRFRADDTVQSLYEFVETRNLDPIPIESDLLVVVPFPRRALEDPTATIQRAGLFPNGAVIVEEALE